MVSLIIYEVIDPQLGSSWASVLKKAVSSQLVIKRTLMPLKETGKQKLLWQLGSALEVKQKQKLKIFMSVCAKPTVDFLHIGNSTWL